MSSRFLSVTIAARQQEKFQNCLIIKEFVFLMVSVYKKKSLEITYLNPLANFLFMEIFLTIPEHVPLHC